MKIRRRSIEVIEFDGLEIVDYTSGLDCSSSIAEITIPAGAFHKRAWSRRSDKYYYIIEGNLSFIVDNEAMELSAGDVCFIRQGVRFNYENKSEETARVILVHTPDFELDEEVFEE